MAERGFLDKPLAIMRLRVNFTTLEMGKRPAPLKEFCLTPPTQPLQVFETASQEAVP
jgi:hypothetical protein